MDNVPQTLLKRGLHRRGHATTRELANFSGADASEVDAYLRTRPDLVTQEADGWRLRREALPILRAEVSEGIERDPERLADVLQPGFLDRVRGSITESETLLTEGRPGGIADEAWLELLKVRIVLTGKAVAKMRGYGRDVSAEEDRLLACRDRFASMAGDA